MGSEIKVISKMTIYNWMDFVSKLLLFFILVYLFIYFFWGGGGKNIIIIYCFIS